MKLILFTIFLFLAFTASSFAQSNDIKFKLAQSYEQGGDWEKAIPLYEELYKGDSSNVFWFDALRRGYVYLKRYDNAVALLEGKLRKQPNDISLTGQLGSVYAKAGKESVATDIWERGIAADKKNFMVYKTVAEAAQENRMWETAIDFYLMGRKELVTPTLFAAEIGSLYSLTMQFEEATSEYLLLLTENPQQISYVQSRLATYTTRPEGVKAATKIVEQVSAKNNDNIAVKKILAWLLMEGKQYGRALEIYRIIDRETKSAGNELYTFAERVFRDKEYFAAASAYHDIIETYPHFSQLFLVRFGFARCIHELSTQTDSASLKKFSGAAFPVSFEQAITAYTQLAADQKSTDIGASCYLQVAKIQFEKFTKPTEALATLEELQKNVAQGSQFRIDGKLLSAEIFTQLGDTAQAANIYRAIAVEKRILSSQKEVASFRLAELLYFAGNLQEAGKLLTELTKILTTDIANDALTLQLLITVNQAKEEVVLRKFAAADFLIRQKKYDDAVAAFQLIAEKNSTSALADDALLHIGSIQTTRKQYDAAIATYQKMINDFPESMQRDIALYNIAGVYETGLNKKPKAIEMYEKLLQDFPQSLYANEARKRIRILRGDPI